MDPTPGVRAALTAARAALEASDATITIAAEAPSGGGLLPSWLPARRNASRMRGMRCSPRSRCCSSTVPPAERGCAGVEVAFDLAVPAGAFLLALASISLLFGPDRDGRKPKNLPLGLLICAVPLVLGVALSLL